MSFFSRIFKRKQKRGIPNIVYTPYGEALLFGQFYNQYSAMNVSAFFACVNLISNSIAMLTPKVLVNGDTGRNELEYHPVKLTLNKRNDESLVSVFQMLKLIVESVILQGNAFVYIQRGSEGKVVGLRYLEPTDVVIDYRKEKDVLYYDVPLLKLRKKIAPEDMLHFVLHSHNGVEGISLLRYACRSLDLANANENAANNFFSNGMNVNGLLQLKTPISEKQKQDIRQSWQQAYSGQGGGLAIINANMEYRQLSLNPTDSQLLESRAFNVADICRFFNINPALIGGDSKVSYSSLEMQMNAFLTFTLQPYITMIETELNRKLLMPSEANLEIVLETNDILRIDKKSQADYYQKMVQSGVLSANEVRKEIGYAPFEGGDEHRIAYSDAAQNTLEDNKSDILEKEEIKE